MFIELLNGLYMCFVTILFSLLRIFPSQKKYVFICDFGDNTFFTIKELLKKESEIEVIIIKSKRCTYTFQELQLIGKNVKVYDNHKFYNSLLGLLQIGTANKIIVDNYFPLLGALKKKPSTEVIQLWHAAGAIKKFALHDPSFKSRYNVAQKRIRNVYQNMNKVIVGSEEMSAIFTKAISVRSDAILHTGVPRTDFFFDSQKMDTAIQELHILYPYISSKTVILYAPTFRENQLESQPVPIDFIQIMNELGTDYVMLIRMHPAVKQPLGLFENEKIIDVSDYPDVNHLLLITDVLITDYSSLPYEFALLNRPQIFYPYDLEQYEKERGFWVPYSDAVPGPIVRSDVELINVIKNGEYDLQRIQAFSSKWNTHSKGYSSANLATYLLKD